MITVGKIWQRVHKTFREYYPTILFISILIGMVVGFVLFDLSQNNRDLLYWKHLISFCCNDLEKRTLLKPMFPILIMIGFVAKIFLANIRSVIVFNEVLQFKFKKRCADVLFKDLIAKIDRPESPYLRITNKNNLNHLKCFVLAYEDMRLAFENLSKDARKLLIPNEMDFCVCQPEKFTE